MDNYKELSTFERWSTELESKTLKWGSKLIHCEKFWRENSKELELHDFKYLKLLISLLKSANSDEEAIAVACYDLGEFVRFYPNGKRYYKRYIFQKKKIVVSYLPFMSVIILFLFYFILHILSFSKYNIILSCFLTLFYYKSQTHI